MWSLKWLWQESEQKINVPEGYVLKMEYTSKFLHRRVEHCFGCICFVQSLSYGILPRLRLIVLMFQKATVFYRSFVDVGCRSIEIL